ncbi:MAG: hypothetical protein QM778_30385 [Myxococcales bacterium]
MQSRKLSDFVYGALLLVVCCWVGSHLYPPINLDVGCLLYVAKRWLAGDRLYVDVIDPNTPWAIALHVPAEFTAATLGLDGPTWFSIYVVAAIAISVGLVWQLARRHEAQLGRLTARILPLAVLFALGVDPGRCFGQREHLLMVAAVPYLVLSTLRVEGVSVPRWQTVSIALIAGLGFAIKPHFVLPLVTVEVYALRARGLRVTLRDPVPWLIAGVLVVHLLLALIGTPEYIAVVIPFATEAYTTPAQMLSNTGKILVGLELAPVTFLLPILGGIAFIGRMTLARLLCLFAAAAALVSALQGKGWDYHSVPALIATLLLVIVTLTDLVERHALASNTLTREATTLLAACLLIPFLFLDGLRLSPFRDQITFSESPVRKWLDVMTKTPGNQRALVLSAGMYPQFPSMNYADFRMTMPFMSLWALRGVYEQCETHEGGFRPVEAQPESERFVYQKVIEGFLEQKPQIVAVDRNDAVLDCEKKNFDYLRYFSRDVRFAREFRNYRPLAKIDVFDFYERMTGAVAHP